LTFVDTQISHPADQLTLKCLMK